MNFALSIIHLTYNRLENLKACLHRFRLSLRDKIPFEIVIVNGGSTDGTTEYLNNLLETEVDLKIKHVFCPFDGWTNPSILRNIATLNATGQILLYTDGDHILSERVVYYATLPYEQNGYDAKIVNRCTMWDSSTSHLPQQKANEIILKLLDKPIIELYNTLAIPLKPNKDKQFWCYAVPKQAILDIGGHYEGFLGAWAREEEFPQIVLQHSGYHFCYDYFRGFSGIHLWHPHGGPDGKRDNRRNHQIFTEKKQDIDRWINENRNEHWGQMPEGSYIKRNF